MYANTQINQQEIIPAKNDIGALANRINMETRSLHNNVDKLVTLKFAIAIKNYKIYRQGIQMFYHIFKAVEIALDRELKSNNKYTEMFQNIYKPEMLRTEKLFTDLMYYYHDKSEHFENPILKGQIEFTDYIKKSTSDHPYLLLAYMHVLYLALFAGGRIMSSQVAKSLSLYPKIENNSYEEFINQGTNFYKFDVEDMETLRIIYKRDYELQTRNFLSEEEKIEIINESKYIFQKVTDGIKEIENHNLETINGTFTYHLITKGYYILLALLTLLICFILKVVISRFFY